MVFSESHCNKLSLAKSGENNPRWKGGKKSFYHYEARKVMAKSLGRRLKPQEVVHHIDGDVKNNKINNLLLFESHSKHIAHHNKLKIRDSLGRFIN